MALKEALQRGSIQSSPYQKQGNVKNSDQLHMFSENQKAYFVVKRSLDIVLSFLLLAVLSPIFIICALAIKLESSGSVIFRQERVGRGGEPFRVYKNSVPCINIRLITLPRISLKTPATTLQKSEKFFVSPVWMSFLNCSTS